jgi:hypothetical protein
MEALYTSVGGPALVLVGDGVHLRLHLGKVDSGWVEPRSLARLNEAYRPRVIIQLDVAVLRAVFEPGKSW